MVSTVQRGESLEDFKAGKPYDWICILERRLCAIFRNARRRAREGKFKAGTVIQVRSGTG